MIRIHVVDGENRRQYAPQLESSFRLRHDIYVKERGWKDLDRPDGREIDQFDSEETLYLLALERDRVVGGMRIVPTTCPTLMSEVFPFLCLNGPVQRPDCHELSRIFVVPERRGEQSQPRVESLLLCAVMEYGLAARLRHFAIVLETWWLPRMQDDGWRLRPLGLPTDIDGMSTVAVLASVAQTSVAVMRRKRAIAGPILVWESSEALLNRAIVA